jgi:hypothetical protein
MGNIKYNEPTSFEDMEAQDEAPVTPKTEAPVAQDPGVQDPGKAVETTEVTE